jgi:hypothetical protein
MQLPRVEQQREVKQPDIVRIPDHMTQATNCKIAQTSQLQNYATIIPKPIDTSNLPKNQGYPYENQSVSDIAISYSKSPINKVCEDSGEWARRPHISPEIAPRYQEIKLLIPNRLQEESVIAPRYQEIKLPIPNRRQEESVIELDKLSPDKISELFNKVPQQGKIEKPEIQNSLQIQHPQKEGYGVQPKIYSHQEQIPKHSEMSPMDIHAKNNQQGEIDRSRLHYPFSQQSVAQASPNMPQLRDQIGYNPPSSQSQAWSVAQASPNVPQSRDQIGYNPPSSQSQAWSVAQASPNVPQSRDQTAYNPPSSQSQASSVFPQYQQIESGQVVNHPYQSGPYEKVPSDGDPASSGQPHLYNQQSPQNPPLKYNQPLIANQPPHSQGALNSTSQSYGQAQSYDQSKSYIHSNQHEHLRIQQEAQYPIQIQTVPSQGYHSLNQHIESNSLAKCCICNSSGNQPSLRQLTICNHIVHEGCFVNFTTSQISRGFLPEKCPNQVCVSNLEPQDVDHTLPESYKLRFQQLYTRQALINSGAEVFECPTCQNVSDKGRLEHLQCPYCKKYYCLKCNSEAHPGQMCRNLSRNPLCRSCQVDHSGMTCDQYTHFLNSHYQER